MNNYLYNNYIYERYKDLKDSKTQLNNKNLSKIFEYYCCLLLTEKYGKQFYEYGDIDPIFKENNYMSQTDTGIDLCDLKDTIGQCKLRDGYLSLRDCSTFLCSQNVFSEELQKTIIKWEKMVLIRNHDSKLSSHLSFKNNIFTDYTIVLSEMINYCEKLLEEPYIYLEEKETFSLRDYQKEAINSIEDGKNAVICLPTGTGKNAVLIFKMDRHKKYLILVPRVILLYQLQQEIVNLCPIFKHKIQLIGDGCNSFNPEKNISICVFNSVCIIEPYLETFDKIFIDEAHHIYKPEIYTDDMDSFSDCSDCSDFTVEDEETDKDTNEEIESKTNSTEETVNSEIEEDELKPSTYLKTIRAFKKYKKNVLLSATIDQIEGFSFYKKDIRDMIEKGYLCDYDLRIPIFTNDPTNSNIADYLINNYRNIIIYCNSKKEGNAFTQILNSKRNGCAEYLDSDTPKKRRENILKRYSEGVIPFLVNIRVLIEGFNSPNTRGICFLHMPSNKTVIIQAIGRALRLSPNKNIAHIILPYATTDDSKHIQKFIQIVSENDRNVKNSLSKNKRGYINIIRDTGEIENMDSKDLEDIQFKFELIYDSSFLSVNGEEMWRESLELVKKYINEKQKRPSQRDKNPEIKRLEKWLSNQITNYKKGKYIMKNNDIRKIWEEFINHRDYKEYF